MIFDLRSDAGSDSSDSGTDATRSGPVVVAHQPPTLQLIDDLENPKRASKRKQKIRTRKKMIHPIKIPLALEPFYGAKPVSLRRSERLKARKS